MNKSPTQQQIKEFWEWCGLREVGSTAEINIWIDKGEDIVSPVYSVGGLPVIDLNNLFKYATDIIVGITFRYYPGGCECELTYTTEVGFETAKSWVKNETGDEKKSKELSALALFWALWQVKEDKQCQG